MVEIASLAKRLEEATISWPPASLRVGEALSLKRAGGATGDGTKMGAKANRIDAVKRSGGQALRLEEEEEDWKRKRLEEKMVSWFHGCFMVVMVVNAKLKHTQAPLGSQGLAQAGCGVSMVRSACHTAELHLNPLPKAICQILSPYATCPSCSDHASSYQMLAEEVFP